MMKSGKRSPVGRGKKTATVKPDKQAPATLILQSGQGSLERRKGINILQLRGTYEEMGRQHAELAREICGDVNLQYFNKIVENLAAHSLPPLAGAIGHSLKWVFHQRNHERLGKRMKAHLGAFAEVFGLSAVEAERVFMVPDIIHYLIGRAFPQFATPPSCSSFFACGDMTDHGQAVIGRNFDFFGRGMWNANNSAIVMHPTGGQSFCWLGTLGVPGSAQGFNESGLFIALHSQFTRDVQTAGQPVFKICHDLLADCHTLIEAIRLIQAKPRLCGLTLFVVDTKKPAAVSVGFSASDLEVVYPVNDLLVQTNHYLTAAMQETLVAPYPWQRNSYGRRQRLLDLLQEKSGRLRATDAPALLSDCWDIYEECKRLTGHIVAGINNSQSVVVSPADDALYLGNADYPVCHSDRFYGFRLSALLAGDAARYELDDLPGGNQLNDKERAALTEYADAWSAHIDQLNNDLAVYHLRRAMSLAPDETIFARMAGLILLTEKKYSQALPLLIRNTEYNYRDKLMEAEAHIWVGRCLDLLRRSDEAQEYYRHAAAMAYSPVSEAARRHLKKPFTARQLFNVSPEFIVGTALSQY